MMPEVCMRPCLAMGLSSLSCVCCMDPIQAQYNPDCTGAFNRCADVRCPEGDACKTFDCNYATGDCEERLVYCPPGELCDPATGCKTPFCQSPEVANKIDESNKKAREEAIKTGLKLDPEGCDAVGMKLAGCENDKFKEAVAKKFNRCAKNEVCVRGTALGTTPPPFVYNQKKLSLPQVAQAKTGEGDLDIIIAAGSGTCKKLINDPPKVESTKLGLFYGDPKLERVPREKMPKEPKETIEKEAWFLPGWWPKTFPLPNSFPLKVRDDFTKGVNIGVTIRKKSISKAITTFSLRTWEGTVQAKDDGTADGHTIAAKESEEIPVKATICPLFPNKPFSINFTHIFRDTLNKPSLTVQKKVAAKLSS